jgi:hypothetical protein
MSDLETLLAETDENPFVDAILTERRMVAAAKWMEAWATDARDGAGEIVTGGKLLRLQLLRATGHMSSLYELYARVHATASRLDARLKNEAATKYVSLRQQPTTKGSPMGHDDVKPLVAKDQIPDHQTQADLDAVKIRVERRIRALDKICEALKATLRSLTDEIRSFPGSH